MLFLKNSTKRQKKEKSGAILINYSNEFTILKNMQLSVECRKTDDSIPCEYLIKNVCDRVVNIILSHHKFWIKYSKNYAFNWSTSKKIQFK